MWIAKSPVSSLNPASYKAKTVLDHKTPSAPHVRLSREAKAKAPCAYSEATAAPLASATLMDSVQPASREVKTRAPTRAANVADLVSLSASSAKKLCHKARGKTLLSANNEALLTLLVGKTLHSRAKFAYKGRTKAVASPREAIPLGEATLASPMAKKKAFKTELKALIPTRLTFNLLGSL